MKAHGAPSKDRTVQVLEAFPPRCQRCDRHLQGRQSPASAQNPAEEPSRGGGGAAGQTSRKHQPGLRGVPLPTPLTGPGGCTTWCPCPLPGTGPLS